MESQTRFQSTHPHGVRRRTICTSYLYRVFQSTHPHGVRHKPLIKSPTGLVSIHAPTRGATPPAPSSLCSFLCFNPRTHTGCDIFNQRLWLYRKSFNPRTHTGCDMVISSVRGQQIVSIHAPTRGATVYSANV